MIKYSPYYEYDFVSPEPIFALVKEEFKSYFDTGSVDDVLFPVWTDKCLKRLGRGSYRIEHDLIEVANYQTTLPKDFLAVREAWLTTCITGSYQLPNATYESVTRKLDCNYDPCDQKCDPCLPDLINVTYKTNTTIQLSYRVIGLLKPGNMNARNFTANNSIALHCSSPDVYDIRGNKLVTNFANGSIYLIYYSKSTDTNGYQLVPDNYRIQEFIEHFLKYKTYEMLCNQVTDETYKQIEAKKTEYEYKAEVTAQKAEVESRMQTIQKKGERIKKARQRFRYFNIP